MAEEDSFQSSGLCPGGEHLIEGCDRLMVQALYPVPPDFTSALVAAVGVGVGGGAGGTGKGHRQEGECLKVTGQRQGTSVNMRR